MVPWYLSTTVQGGEETVPKWWKLFPRGWRPVKMHTNEHPVPQTIGKMQVVGSKLCKRARRGCNLSKRQIGGAGPRPPHFGTLAEIASPPQLFCTVCCQPPAFYRWFVGQGARLYAFLLVATLSGTVSTTCEQFPHSPVLYLVPYYLEYLILN